MQIQRSLAVAASVVAIASGSRADIYRWDTGAVIPGTEGITPGPGMQFWSDLTFANLSNLDLRGALFWDQTLVNASFDGSNLTGASFHESNLTDADFSDTIIRGAQFDKSTFNASQLISTASYKNKDLRGVSLTWTQVSGINFVGFNLDGAAGVAIGNLTDASVIGADLAGISKEQLYSTASYKGKNLRGITFWGADLSGADLTGQDLTDSIFFGPGIMAPNAIITGAILLDATIEGANFGNADLTMGQLYSTASYKSKNLQRVKLGLDLTGYDLSGQNLSGALLGALANADLRGADLSNAYLSNSNALSSTAFDPTTVYNQWTVFPSDFDPAAHGLAFVMSPSGDLNANGILDAKDLDWLAQVADGRAGASWQHGPDWWLSEALDLTADGQVDDADHHYWVKELRNTWLGDAGLDGEFNSSDLVVVLASHEYEDGIHDNSGWATGDFDGDGDFTSSDLVTALAEGGYEQGLRAASAAVPEPSSFAVQIGALLILALLGQRRA